MPLLTEDPAQKASHKEGRSSLAPLQRARGNARVGFGRNGLIDLYQSGSAKILLPSSEAGAEAVLVNTAGGMTGGDQFSWDVRSEASALTITTQAAERLYKSSSGTALVEARLRATQGARLHWLPQELIVYEGGAMERRLIADVETTSELLMVESMIFGRTAMKEEVRRALIMDQWRVSRDGHLLHAEAFRMEEPEKIFAGLGAFNGAISMATLLLVSLDAEDRLDVVRAALNSHEGVIGGASAWSGKLVVRLLAEDAMALRKTLIHVLGTLRGHNLPKVWRL